MRQEAQTGGLADPAAKRAPAEVLEALSRGRNPHTVRSDLKGIEAFGQWLGTPDFPALWKTFLFGGRTTGARQGNANRLVSGYRAYLMEEKYAPSTVRRRLDSLKSLTRVARMFGFVTFNLEIQAVRVETYRDTKGPGEDAILDVLDRLGANTDSVSIRDRAIIGILYYDAFRRNEVAALDLKDVDLKNVRLWVTAKKRASKTAVTIAGESADNLRAWMGVRGTEEGPLFHGLNKGYRGIRRISGSSVWRIVRGYKLGHTHGLRHTSVTEFAKKNKGDIIALMKHARHADPKTTMIYIDNLEEGKAEGANLLAAARKKRLRDRKGKS